MKATLASQMATAAIHTHVRVRAAQNAPTATLLTMVCHVAKDGSRVTQCLRVFAVLWDPTVGITALVEAYERHQ